MAGQNVWVKSGKVMDLLVGATTTSTGAWRYKDAPKATIQATVTGTGAITAGITIEVSNDGTNAVGTALGTISLSGTTSASDGFTTDAPWKYIRARVTSTGGAGTISSIDVNLGV